MKKKNFFYITTISLLVILLVSGYLLNKKNSLSKKNEIFNLNQQILTKNLQLSKIQEYFIKNKKNINDFIDPNYINFSKILSNKQLKNLKGYDFDKYRTNEILSSGNYKAIATAYIDFFNNDEELILTTVDGIFAFGKIDSLEKLKKIESNLFDLVSYKEFYTNVQYGIKDILVNKNNLFVSLINEKKKIVII